MELKGKKVNFLGDSITEGVGTSCEEAMFPNILKNIAEFSEIRNYGISGTRIAHQKPENGYTDDRDYCRRYTTMDDDTDIIVVFGGTNDYGHGNAEFGCDTDRTPDTFCGAVHYLMAGLLKKYPTKDIVFLTPIHREGENLPNSHGKILSDYVEAIKRTATHYSIPVLDMYNVGGICPDVPEQKESLCPDGLHPNDAGHMRMALRIKSFLESL